MKKYRLFLTLAGAGLLLSGCQSRLRRVTLDTEFYGVVDGVSISAIALQPDGKVLLGGKFGSIAGTTRNGIARFHENGTLESAETFNPGVGTGSATDRVYAIAVLADGGILIGGTFSSVGGIACPGLARLNADGSMDSAFAVAKAAGVLTQEIRCIAIQNDGDILVGGSMSLANPLAERSIVRLHSNGTLDTSFDAEIMNGMVTSIAQQADGKVLTGGLFTTVDGVARNRLARLESGGTLDTGFEVQLGGAHLFPHVGVSIVVQHDQKILIAGAFNEVAGQSRNGIARLDQNGDLDVASFSRNFSDFSGSISSLALQANGSVIGAGTWEAGGTPPIAASLDRWDANGARGGLVDGEVGGSRGVALRTSGKLLMGYNGYGYSQITADSVVHESLNMLGGGEVSWIRPEIGPEVSQVVFEFSTNNANWSRLGPGTRIAGGWNITGLSLPNSGWLRARGRTSSGESNGSSGLVERVLKFPADSFAPDTAIVSGPAGTTPVPSATFIFGSNEPVLHFTYRLDGGAPMQTAESVTFASLSNGQHTLSVSATDLSGNEDPLPVTRTWTVDPGALIPGAPDPTFLHTTAPPDVSGGSVFRLAVQPDGKFLASGSFSTVNGEPRRYFARFLPGGALESTATFDIGDGALSYIQAMAVQPDGKILIAGSFTEFNSQPRARIARLDENGTVEPAGTFNIGSGASSIINSMALESDGKIVIAGEFTTFNGQPREHIARLNSNGTLDPDYQPTVDGLILCMTIQSDGKILIGGAFSNVNGQSRNGIARLHTDGTLDTAFTSPFNFGYPIALAVQPDGKILVAGSTFDATFIPKGLVRLLPDGTLEAPPAFINGNNFQQIDDMILQADGKIIIVGGFSAVAGQPRGGIARLNRDGSPEPTTSFDTGAGAFNAPYEASIHTVALQADGKILLGGNFTSVGGQPFTQLARLNNDGAISELIIQGTSAAGWARSSSTPEVEQVTFELITPGGTEFLSPVYRTVSGWVVGDLNLPSNGTIRTRGRVSGRMGNGGLVEKTLTFGAPVESWRNSNFGNDAANPAIAGNLADPDGDGASNLFEYASGTDPLRNDGTDRLQWGFEGATVTFIFDRSLTAPDATITAQTSEDLVTWTNASYTEHVLSSNGVTEKVKITMPFDITNPPAPKGFVRAKVSVGP